MIALVLALVLGTAQTQECGPVDAPTGQSVTWWGAPSADLAPVGVGSCGTGAAWLGDIETSSS